MCLICMYKYGDRKHVSKIFICRSTFSAQTSYQALRNEYPDVNPSTGSPRFPMTAT